MKTIPLKEKYEKEVVGELKNKFGYNNIMSVPKLEKVVVNAGVGKMLKEGDKIEEVFESISQITGQRPIKTKAKKAVAGFKVREDMEIGIKVTLRGKKMWSFMDRLVGVSLPRTRDFQGIKSSSVDSNGNINIGIKEQIIFPEISPEKVKNIFGMQITVVTSAVNKQEGMELFRMLGFPIQK